MSIPPVGDVVEPDQPEFFEVGVLEIEYAASQNFNRSYHPRDGIVKWFQDGTGAWWAKWNADSGEAKHRCVPADRIVVVIYNGHSQSILDAAKRDIEEPRNPLKAG